MAKGGDSLGLLLGISKPKGKAGPEEERGEAELAASALLKAIRRDDERGVVEAFRQLKDCCDDDYEESDDTDDED